MSIEKAIQLKTYSFKKNLPLNRYEMEQEIANTNASARKLKTQTKH